MQQVKVKGQSVHKLEQIQTVRFILQTDGQTEGRTEATALPSPLMRSVNRGNKQRVNGSGVQGTCYGEVARSISVYLYHPAVQ